MKSTSFIAGALVVASQLVGTLAVSPSKVVRIPDEIVHRADDTPSQTPTEMPIPGSSKSQGCFSSKGNFTVADVKATEVSTGSCQKYCKTNDFTVCGLSGQQCFCGHAYPPKKSLSDDKKCNYPCPAYDLEACGGVGGGNNYWSVFNLGVQINVPYYTEDKPKSSSSSTAAAPTKSSSQSAPENSASHSEPPKSDNKDNGGPNVAGVVAGSVVGVAAFAAGAGGLWFFMRRRRNTEIEEEHRRNAAVNAFISGSKPPGSSGSISMTDSRLDPVMANRRLSDGSIADNEDYSRKILRVTNA